MIGLAVFLVVCSGLTHAVWNVFTKISRNKAVFLWCIYIPATVGLLPYSGMEFLHVRMTGEIGGLLVLSMAVQGVYAWMLTLTYVQGDMSQVYPLMRGTATLLIPIIGVLWLQESLSTYDWLGIGCMLCGFIVMSLGSRGGAGGSGGLKLKPVVLALGTGLCTTGYVVIDKSLLEYFSVLTVLEISNIGFVLGLTAAVARSKRLKAELAAGWKTMLLGAILSPGSYLLFLFAMNLAPIAHISPIRDIGIVFGTWLGITVLRERQGAVRLAASVLIAGGIVLIGLLGA